MDINYCYKIVLAGMTEQGQEQKFWKKYGNIRIFGMYKSGEQETEEWVGISREEAEQECGKRMEYKLSEKNGVVMAVVQRASIRKEWKNFRIVGKKLYMRTHT